MESIASSNISTGKPTRKFRYVLVTGGRDFNGDSAVEKAMQGAVDRLGDVIFINGGAKGADTLCSVFAITNSWPVYVYPAQWKRDGRAAGPIRNRLMLEMHPDIELVLAFHDFLPHSSGTYDMCVQALRRGIPVMHYTDDGWFAAFLRVDDLPPKKDTK